MKKMDILNRKCIPTAKIWKDLKTLVKEYWGRRKVSNHMHRAIQSKILLIEKITNWLRKRKEERWRRSFNEDEKSCHIVAEIVESQDILSSSSEWNLGFDKLFVTSLNCNSKKMGKTKKGLLNFQKLQIIEDKKERICGTKCSKWKNLIIQLWVKKGSDKLFVTCLGSSENKVKKKN